jgi:hypothetical protein
MELDSGTFSQLMQSVEEGGIIAGIMGQWGFVGDIWVISEFSKTIFLRAY